MSDSRSVSPRTAPEANPNRPPFETFKGATCRGSYSLGSACGKCEKCVWERGRIDAALGAGVSPRTATPEPTVESASAALYGFAGWLTSQPELVQFCDRSDAALAADLVALFCKAQGYADPPEGWAAALKPYPKVPSRGSATAEPTTPEATQEEREAAQEMLGRFAPRYGSEHFSGLRLKRLQDIRDFVLTVDGLPVAERTVVTSVLPHLGDLRFLLGYVEELSRLHPPVAPAEQPLSGVALLSDTVARVNAAHRAAIGMSPLVAPTAPRDLFLDALNAVGITSDTINGVTRWWVEGEPGPKSFDTPRLALEALISLRPVGSPEAPTPPTPNIEHVAERLEDYESAPSGVGPFASEWKDKPHRLVYDLVKEYRALLAELSRLTAEKASLWSRVAQAEADALALIDERDRREGQITAIYHALGGTGEWSSACDLGDEALELAENSAPASRVAQLEAQLAAMNVDYGNLLKEANAWERAVAAMEAENVELQARVAAMQADAKAGLCVQPPRRGRLDRE